MPIFTYKALDQDKKIVNSTTSAESKDAVATELAKKGLTPITISESSNPTKSKDSLPTVEKMTFCRYMGTMLKSGLSVSEAIEVLLDESTNAQMKKILSDLNYSLDQGQTMSAVFARYPNSFDSFFTTIIKSGEISGTLADTFNQLEEEVRAEHTLKQTIQGAMLYPSVVFIAMLGIGVLMFFFILPQIGQVFLNLKLPLNPATELMFRVTLVLGKYKYYILSSLVASSIAIGLFFRTKAGKRAVHKIISPIPVVKNLVKQMDVARFCRVFSTLLQSGVPITEALQISLDSLSYTPYKKLGKAIVAEVTKGTTMSVAFKNTQIFPPLLTQMITSGEKSGTLDSTLKDLGEFYEQEVEANVKKATQILEPVLMLIVGIGVGIMVLSVITPIYSVVSNLQAVR